MKSIRRGVFETNSSSTHSLTICSKDDFKAWKDGNVFFMRYPNEKFISKEEAVEILKAHKYIKCEDYDDKGLLEEALAEAEIYTYDRFFASEYLESYEQNHTTKSGDEIVAFGMYGHD